MALKAAVALIDMDMWEAFHLPHMPANFKHWRERYRESELL